MDRVHAVLESETHTSYNIQLKRNQTLKFWGIGLSFLLLFINLIRLTLINFAKDAYNENLKLVAGISIIDIVLNVVLQLWMLIRFSYLFNYFVSSTSSKSSE